MLYYLTAKVFAKVAELDTKMLCTLWDELKLANADVKSYLKMSLINYYKMVYLKKWVEAHVSYSNIPATQYIIESLNECVVA
jgi:hypothetical protein